MGQSKRKIAIFSPSLRGGGAEKVMITLAHGFLASKFDVDFVLAQSTGPHLKNIPLDCKLVDLKASRVMFSIFPLIKYLRSEQPNVLLSSMTSVNNAALIAKIISNTSVRIVIRIDNTLSESNKHAEGIRDKIQILVTKFFSHKSDCVVAISEGVKRDFINIIDNKININSRVKIINNPIDLNLVQEMSMESPSHHWLLDDEIPIIVAAGRLVKQKDFCTLVRAFKIVRQKRKARLAILGDGPERKHIESLVHRLHLSESVILPGFQENPYVWMVNGDLFVLSSAWEGFGNVVLEALALGVRVVATDCKYGPKEILDGGRFGTLVPVGDYEKMAQAMEKSLSLNIDSNFIRNRALQYNTDKIVPEYLKVLFPDTQLD